MNIVTNGLVGLAMAQAGATHGSRLRTPLLILASVVADLDLVFYFGGAETFLAYHRTLLHSLLGSTVAVLGLAGFSTFADRRFSQKAHRSPLSFRAAVLICALGAASHILLDLCDTNGVQVLWPFWNRWFAWDLAPQLDPWLLVILLAGILLPALFRLISEEIGERHKSHTLQRGAILALLLAAVYLGARATLHARAMHLLISREYHGEPPLAAGAFPEGASPLEWRGIAALETLYRQVEISFTSGDESDPERAVPHYKPEPSPALSAASGASAVKMFLRYAQFPLANVEEGAEGFRVEIRDLRFPADSDAAENLLAFVEMDAELNVTRQGIRFAGAGKH